jgi:GNAT superfamily N-acetyltransferase
VVLSAVDTDGRLRVRVAGPDDVPALAALRRGLTEEQVGGPVEDSGFEDALAAWFERERHQRITWLAEVGGRPVGMLNLVVFTRMPKPRSAGAPGAAGQWGYVANVYVERDRRDRGIGGALLDEAVQHADRHGFARLVLAPSERSVPLYERAGFGPATALMVRPGR